MFSKAQTRSISALLAGLIVQLPIILPMPAKATTTGWVLTQRSRDFGDQYVYLSAGGVRCVNPRRGIGLVARGPSWDVSCYNDKTRLYYCISFSKWKQKLDARRRGGANLTWHRGQFAQIAGLRATKYSLTNPASGQGVRGRPSWLSAECWVADDIKVPPQLAEMLSSTYGLPTTQSVPLKIILANSDGSSETILDTYRQQVTAIPESYLRAPAGYNLAKSEVEVMLTEENRQLVDDIARDIGREPQSLSGTHTGAAPSIPINIPNSGVTLPNGQQVSKDQINKYIDAFKRYKQTGGQ